MVRFVGPLRETTEKISALIFKSGTMSELRRHLTTSGEKGIQINTWYFVKEKKMNEWQKNILELARKNLNI